MNRRTLRFCLVSHFHTHANKLPRIDVVRHAESVWNEQPGRRVQGSSVDPTIFLSDNGKKSIKSELAPLKKPNLLICSPLLRCKQTAEVWFDCDFEHIPIKTIINPDLKEINAGIFEGRYIDELTDEKMWRSWLTDPLTFQGFPKGETPLEFQKRVLCAFSKICTQFDDPSQHICIITHGIVMRVLKCFIDNKNLAHLWDYDVKNLERITLKKDHIDTLKFFPDQVPYLKNATP